MFKSVVFALGLAASVLAQNIQIGGPAEFASITAGSNITVEVDRPDSLTGSQEVAIVIALNSCSGHPDNSCASFDVTQDLGHILYSGPYDPEFHQGAGLPNKPPYQNFSVQVPSNLPAGEAALTVSHFSLVGAGPFPFFEVKNITLTVA
ncbi:hypothetical protein CERSUDRAFT_81333 [Gelatoporia subvermispora B]|uniref:Uncharacterized protein n=1 Tax=Ceriporiopsis subvermispora (strain B) TaxID=914234 RepID=M2PTK2_CERS8|nr:hypothetical protein CERSUDRAFT_81333 [Gelatoporia subvermispora B]